MKTVKYEKYEHHGKEVWVRTYVKGQHRKYCLCFSCKKFYPENNPEGRCPIADEVYNLCVKHNLVTPVWECPEFDKLEKS